MAAIGGARATPAGDDDTAADLRAVSSSLQEALTTAISTGRGISGIATVLQDALGGTVVIEDGLRTRIASVGAHGEPATELPTERPPGAPRHAVAFRVDEWLLVEACPASELLGTIGLLDGAPDATGSPESALELGAMVLAAEVFRLHSVASNELRVWGDLAAELLDDPDIERSRSHATALGYSIDRPHRALVIELVGPGRLPSKETIQRAFRSAGVDGTLATTRKSGIVLFVADDADWDGVARELNGTRQLKLRVGIGDYHEPVGLNQSVTEAVLALRLSGAPVSRYADLGICRFLASDADETRLRSFVDDWVGALAAYDDTHDADLVGTLGEWLRDQRSLRAAAERLHIHPSTLKYRLGRISQLTGRDLHDPESRFNLDLACRTRDTLLALEASGEPLTFPKSISTTGRPGVTHGGHALVGVDPSTVEVAVLDTQGVLTWVNDAWRSFCEANGGTIDRCGVGTSYPAACARAQDDPQSGLALWAVQLAIRGELPAPVWLTLACHSPDVSRWFEMTVSSRRDDGGRCCGATITLAPTVR